MKEVVSGSYHQVPRVDLAVTLESHKECHNGLGVDTEDLLGEEHGVLPSVSLDLPVIGVEGEAQTVPSIH
jgi:hypothetical protein